MQFNLSPYHQFSNSSLNHDFYDRFLSHDSQQPLQTPLIGIERSQDLLSLKLPPHGTDQDADCSQRFASKEWHFEDSKHDAGQITRPNSIGADNSRHNVHHLINHHRINHHNRAENGSSSPARNNGNSGNSNNNNSSTVGRNLTSSNNANNGNNQDRQQQTNSYKRKKLGSLEELRRGFPFNYKSSNSSQSLKDAELVDQREPIDLNVSYDDDCCNDGHNDREDQDDEDDNNKNSIFNESMKHFNPNRVVVDQDGCFDLRSKSNSPNNRNNSGNNNNSTNSQKSISNGSNTQINKNGTNNNNSNNNNNNNNNNDDNDTGNRDGEEDEDNIVAGLAQQYHGQESMFGIDPSKQKFQYVLAAPISVATKLNEDTMTYLNQAQPYEIKLENMTDVAEAKKGFMCSIINIGFHERHMQQAENELWQQWSHQHPNEKIFSVDMKLSYNVFGVESDGLNKYEFLWDSSKAAGVFIRINSISTEFTPRKHGGEKGVPFKLSIETFSYNSKTHDSYFISAACCQMKVFKPKGAERKIRSDRDKISKRPLMDQEKYHRSCDYTSFKECSLTSLHPMAGGSICYYRHSHGHFASKQVISSASVGGTPSVQANQTSSHHSDEDIELPNNTTNSQQEHAPEVQQQQSSTEQNQRSSQQTNNNDSETSNNAQDNAISQQREYQTPRNVISLTGKGHHHTDYSTNRLMQPASGGNNIGTQFGRSNLEHHHGQDHADQGYHGAQQHNSDQAPAAPSLNHNTPNELLQLQQPTSAFNSMYHGNHAQVRNVASLATSMNNSQHFGMAYYGHHHHHHTLPTSIPAHISPSTGYGRPPASAGALNHSIGYQTAVGTNHNHPHHHPNFPLPSQQHLAKGAPSIYRAAHEVTPKQPPLPVPNGPLPSTASYTSSIASQHHNPHHHATIHTPVPHQPFKASSISLTPSHANNFQTYLDHHHHHQCIETETAQDHHLKPSTAPLGTTTAAAAAAAIAGNNMQSNQHASNYHQHENYESHHLHHFFHSTQNQQNKQQHQQHQQSSSFRQRTAALTSIASNNCSTTVASNYMSHESQANRHLDSYMNQNNGLLEPHNPINHSSHYHWNIHGSTGATGTAVGNNNSQLNSPIGTSSQRGGSSDVNMTTNNNNNNNNDTHNEPYGSGSNNNYDCNDHLCDSEQNSPNKSLHHHQSDSSSSCFSRFKNNSSTLMGCNDQQDPHQQDGNTHFNEQTSRSNDDQNHIHSHHHQQQQNENQQHHHNHDSANSAASSITIGSSCAEVVAWFEANRFRPYTKTFRNFCGSDLLRLSKTELIEICGLIDGIRLFNSIHNQPIKPRRVLYICHKNDEIFHPIYLYDVTLKELLKELSVVFANNNAQRQHLGDEKSVKNSPLGDEKPILNPSLNSDSRSSMGAPSTETIADDIYSQGEHGFFNDVDMQPDIKRQQQHPANSLKSSLNGLNNNNSSNNNNTNSFVLIQRLLIEGLTSVKIVATEQVVQMLEDESAWTLSLTSGNLGHHLEACISACRSVKRTPE